MGSRHSFLRLSLLGIAVALGSLLLPETASAQYGAWRGRTMTRDGLFRVTRTHWGNGITPTGASVLIPLIEAAPGIINAAQGRGTDSQTSSRGSSWAGWDAYAAEQKRATDLLARLDGIVNGSTPDPTPPGLPTGEFPPVDELIQKYGGGSNPWSQ